MLEGKISLFGMRFWVFGMGLLMLEIGLAMLEIEQLYV